MNKIVVIGVSCSGKSTFGLLLSKALGLPFIDLDDLYWKPGWVQSDEKSFVSKVTEVTKTEKWIIVGNYRVSQSIVLESADTVIWLDYSKLVVGWRAISRTVSRSVFKESCCNGNYESWKLSFFSKESILLWVIKDYSRKKKRYSEMIDTGIFAGKDFYRIRSLKEADRFVSNLK